MPTTRKKWVETVAVAISAARFGKGRLIGSDACRREAAIVDAGEHRRRGDALELAARQRTETGDHPASRVELHRGLLCAADRDHEQVVGIDPIGRERARQRLVESQTAEATSTMLTATWPAIRSDCERRPRIPAT